MATRVQVNTTRQIANGKINVRVSWTLFAGDVGDAAEMQHCDNKSCEVYFSGPTGNVDIQTSNDGSNWFSNFGTGIAAAQMATHTAYVSFVRPNAANLTAGTAMFCLSAIPTG